MYSAKYAPIGTCAALHVLFYDYHTFMHVPSSTSRAAERGGEQRKFSKRSHRNSWIAFRLCISRPCLPSCFVLFLLWTNSANTATDGFADLEICSGKSGNSTIPAQSTHCERVFRTAVASSDLFACQNNNTLNWAFRKSFPVHFGPPSLSMRCNSSCSIYSFASLVFRALSDSFPLLDCRCRSVFMLYLDRPTCAEYGPRTRLKVFP